ncbi:Uu.00g015020.m01.CDS01 [Anthostomella pinea]|uniref:Uu.00g015020.m01.CDS01 n=1 Tax=Anthostomella pinea TaxID=933095 RepID=A0AAI8YQC6_9PEZI|nr:Uu.00g015020.m01.CDS01 [Anthostomella pinea]
MFACSILAIVLVALGFGQHARAQGFVGNCTWQTGLMADSFLGMYCNNDDWAHFSYQWTWFDTNLCLINNGGSLIPYDTGNYWPTCRDFSVRGSNVDYILSCTCYQPDGKLAPTTYDLNRVLSNQNGSLGCFGHEGNKTEAGPF